MSSLLFSPNRYPISLKYLGWLVVSLFVVPLVTGITPELSPSERMELSPSSLLLDISIIKDEIIVVGERGHILKSKDGGESWRQVTTPTRTTLTNVFFADDKHGWASGHSGVILSTTDGGDSWTHLAEPDPEISYFDAYFSDEWKGFFVGSYGQYSKTMDAGTSLENEYINDLDPHFYSIKESPNGDLFIAGEMGQILRSTNQGRSWKTLKFPYEGSLFDLLCIGENTLLTFGLRGHVFRSENNGNRWEEIKHGEPEMLTTGIVLSTGTILLASVADKVLMSNDEGMTFYPISLQGIDGTVAIQEDPNKQKIYFCGNHGFLAVDLQTLETSLKQAASSNE